MIPGDRIAAFIEKCSAGAYVEPESELHTQITRQVWEQKVKPLVKLPSAATVLDIGCGSGLAMRMFTDEGFVVIGVTCLEEEARAIAQLSDGIGVAAIIDMHSLGIPRTRYDLVWARHCLEHTPCPAFVLHEINSVLNPGGWLYVECPLPDTACAHTSNGNHWTVLTKSGWQQLIVRSGFTIMETLSIKFAAQAGEDEYVGFICQKLTVDNKAATE